MTELPGVYPQALNASSLRTSKDPGPPKFRGSGTLSEGAGESAGAHVRFVDPSPSDLYGNIATFGESGLLEARSERAYNACDIQLKILNICFRDAGMQFAENHHRIQNFPTKAPCLHSPLAVISTASSTFHHCFDSLLSFYCFDFNLHLGPFIICGRGPGGGHLLLASHR